ncbi:Cupin domain protein [Caballeronia catudaia]|uniref:Cupin domain protein n=1 Tax=Caballeronia catudaia TaxID=1777136 RepID=A0A157ZZ51_9BURK|nr:cupin domain-containing protein [Caballeronia catudaia]SAK50822.1 Cupin domain protein [Caballeronia catudaia]
MQETEQKVVTVRPQQEIAAAVQRLPYFIGLSARTAGTRGLSMHLVVVPPGGQAEPHIHVGYETGIYILEGRIETRYGPGLAESVINEPGDFVFIPPGVPHQPVNLSATEPARAVIARNDANEADRVIPYDPAEASRV